MGVQYWSGFFLALVVAAIALYTVLQSKLPDADVHWLGWVLWWYGAVLLVLGMLFGLLSLAFSAVLLL